MSVKAPEGLIWFIHYILEVGEYCTNRTHGKLGPAVLVIADGLEAQFKLDKLNIYCAVKPITAYCC